MLTGAVAAAVIAALLAGLVYWLAGGPDLLGALALDPRP